MNGTLPQSTPFAPTSRYYGLGTAVLVDSQNVAHAYVLRRFVPPADAFATLELHTVVEGERYDTIAARYIGDPLQFWRLADANGVIDPADLESPGRTVRITLPAGLPGYPSD
jgi:hypothetical protein